MHRALSRGRCPVQGGKGPWRAAPQLFAPQILERRFLYSVAFLPVSTAWLTHCCPALGQAPFGLPFYGNDASGVALQFARAPCRSPKCRCRACMPHRDTAELPHDVCCRLRLGRHIPRRCRQPLLHKPHRQPSKPLGVEVRRFWRGVVASGCGELCRVGVQQRSMICAP